MDYEQIRKSEDRSFSLILVEKLKACSDEDELEEIVHTIHKLDDYRTEQPLREIMENTENAALLRAIASDALCGCTTPDDIVLERAWWNSGDEILMRHAIRVSSRTNKELLRQIASDPVHKFYTDALESMSCRFEEPYFRQLKMNAMYSDAPSVRRTSAESLLWDQPIAAEPRLLILANDDDDEVAEEAIDVLCYCQSQATLRGLADLANSGRMPLREMHKHALEEVRSTFESSIKSMFERSPEAVPVYRQWLRPVEDLFDWDELQRPEVHNSSQPRAREDIQARLGPQEIIEWFNNADGRWADRFGFCNSLDYGALTASDKTILESFFSSHIDWSVRERGAFVLAKLDSGNSLLKLLDDPVLAVRQAASYWIREVSKDERIATRLWEVVQDDSVGGVNASEALESYVIHDSFSPLLNDKLVTLALTDQRESIVSTAVWKLKERGAKESIESVLSILSREPLITWSVHSAILEACVDLDIAVPNIEELRKIDDLHAQESLAMLVSINRHR